jgi:hypothetical protein
MVEWEVTVKVRVCTPDDGTDADAMHAVQPYIDAMHVRGVTAESAVKVESSNQPNSGATDEH